MGHAKKPKRNTLENMPEPFVPKQPEKKIVIEITKREAVLLQKLRKYPFGKFLVYKADNRIIRVEITDSQMIEEDSAVDLT